MKLEVRKSSKSDIPFLEKLEIQSFSNNQRTSKRNLVHSIQSRFQEVLIVEASGKLKIPLGALVLFKYSKSLRIYSIAIIPEYRNQGVGDFLLNYVFQMAKQLQYERILLELSASNNKLFNWYLAHGFKLTKGLSNYYAPGVDALKMEYIVDANACGNKITNVIVINQPNKWTFPDVNAKVISVKEYISNPIYYANTDLRIFNLCSSYKYQSYGYYVSLLASARGQRVIPSTITIRDFRLVHVIHSVASDIEETINKSLNKVKSLSFSLNVYFGQTNTKGFNALAMKLYHLFEAPLFSVDFVKHDKWIIKDLHVLTLKKISESEINHIYYFARKYFAKKRFNSAKLINYKYDIAVLVDPNETTPPSCEKALQKFKSAANRKGLYLEFITKSDFNRINEFDALFIRETTNVNNYTYEFSRMAYAEGLVVIDDPWSILKCSNKIYQNEIFRKHKILTPETTIFTKNLFKSSMLCNMNFPLVFKQPDSAFSLGVIKADTQEEALLALNKLFKISDMVVCQEFLYSEFDWRIGVLDNKPLFACKYYMSKGHWQIYDWKSKEEDNSGDSETLCIDEVPEVVLRTALKAAALIGDGLYGVDLKMLDGKVYVVEVNDNPNIDADIEDYYLKDQLYDRIIESIFNRIEISKNIQKINFLQK
jgi:glutathione synthase/RimK-type ligase-like ATP-grasp enzyme/ribosomal protein S18 acetylase RimI-like enzyme